MNIESKNIVYTFNKGYYVNDIGNVISPKGTIRKLYKHKNYCSFGVKIGNDVKTIQVHKLQAYQKFKEYSFTEGLQVRHLNGNSLDNSISNIMMGTRSENALDKPVEIRRTMSSNASKIHNHSEIIKDRQAGFTYKDIMDKYNISSKGTIAYIIKNSMEKLK